MEGGKFNCGLEMGLALFRNLFGNCVRYINGAAD